MQTIEASKALETIVASVAKQEMRKPGPMKIGQRIHQGDVYLCLVADDHKRGPLLGTKQIAVGTTVGSRHVVEGDVQVFAGVELPKDMDLRLTTAQQELVDENKGGIRFFPDGSSTGGNIAVVLGQREWKINVGWLTGEITLDRPENTQ